MFGVNRRSLGLRRLPHRKSFKTHFLPIDCKWIANAQSNNSYWVILPNFAFDLSSYSAESHIPRLHNHHKWGVIVKSDNHAFLWSCILWWYRRVPGRTTWMHTPFCIISCAWQKSSYCQAHAFEVWTPTSTNRQLVVCFTCPNFIPI